MASKLKAVKPAETKPGHLKSLIFGASGVGKTWLSLTFPKPYYIDVEGGARLGHYQARLLEVGGAYFGPEEGAGHFPTVIEQVLALATEQHDYKTLVIDSLTKLWNTTITEEARRLGDKDAFGASKKPAIQACRQLINAIDKLDMNVFLICHEKNKYSDGEQRGVEEDAWDKLRYEIDLACQIVKQGPSRYAIVSKSRLTGFLDGDRFLASYDEFASRYGKDHIEASAAPVVLATPEQLAEITRLLDIIKIDEDEISKWHTKAKATGFAEYKQEQAEAIIKHLKGKLK